MMLTLYILKKTNFILQEIDKIKYKSDYTFANYRPKCSRFPSNLKISDRCFVAAQGFGAGKIGTMSSPLIDPKSSI